MLVSSAVTRNISFLQLIRRFVLYDGSNKLAEWQVCTVSDL